MLTRIILMFFVLSAANADVKTPTETAPEKTVSETSNANLWHAVYRPDISASDIPEDMRASVALRLPAFRFRADSVEILVGDEVKITTDYEMASEQAAFEIQGHPAHANFTDDYKSFTLKEGDGTRFLRQ